MDFSSKKRLNFAFSLFFICIFAFSCKKTEKDVHWIISEDEKNNNYVYEKCRDSVVRVLGYRAGNLISRGSGVVIEKNNYILTNHHVIENCDEVWITGYNNQQSRAIVRIQDTQEDLAILECENRCKWLKGITLSSGDFKVGDKCIAISYPVDDMFVSSGHIGAVLHPVRDARGVLVRGMIVSDSRVSKGSSGSALLNKKGELIGLNYAVFKDDDLVNFSYSYDVNILSKVVANMLQSLKEGRRSVKKAAIDACFISFDEIKNDNYYPSSLNDKSGVCVIKILPGGNVDGILKVGGRRDGDYSFGGDIIVKLDGYDIRNTDDIYTALCDNIAGDEVEVRFIRNQKESSEKIKLSERKSDFESRFIKKKI